jgi:hypothetical protein
MACGQLDDQIEEFDGIIQRAQPLIMQVGRIVLDPAQREGLDAAIPDLHRVVDHFGLEEPLGPEIVHQVVGILGRLIAAPALALAEEHFPAGILLYKL